MNKSIFGILFISFSILFSCKAKKDISNNSTSPVELIVDTSKYDRFEYENEQLFLQHKKKICSDLGLYDIQDLKSGYELRLWEISSMTDPDELYILKGKDSSAILFRYLYFHLGKKDGKIDSVLMKSLKPKTLTWKEYFEQLNLDSLITLKSQSEIKGKSFGMLDGYMNFTEIYDSGYYKYLKYSDPEYFQEKDTNFKKFVIFKTSFTKPLNYQGMINAPW